MCLKGPWLHNRVSSSLVSYLIGNEELVAKDLQEFEDKAVFNYKHPDELKRSGAAIMVALQTQAGIFD